MRQAAIVGVTGRARCVGVDNPRCVGVDLGVKALATLSTGEVIRGPKAHMALLGRVRRTSRRLSRKVKGSNNRRKARVKLARLYARIAVIRADALRKHTTDLTRRFPTLGIEDLNVRGMVKNRPLPRSIAARGFFAFRRQLAYRAAMRGGWIVVADRSYASPKTCLVWGHRLDDLPLAVRAWTCPAYGTPHDRNVNAARNLKTMAVSSTVSAGEREARPSSQDEDETGLDEAGSQQRIGSAPSRPA